MDLGTDQSLKGNWDQRDNLESTDYRVLDMQYLSHKGQRKCHRLEGAVQLMLQPAKKLLQPSAL
jgi:hypothetical protein